MKKLILAAAMFLLAVGPASAQFSPAVEQWRPAVEEACAANGCSTDYLLSVIACESGGVEYIQSANINPGTGTYDYGLLQISTIWGGQSMSGVQQIWFAAEHLGRDVWWAC